VVRGTRCLLRFTPLHAFVLRHCRSTDHLADIYPRWFSLAVVLLCHHAYLSGSHCLPHCVRAHTAHAAPSRGRYTYTTSFDATHARIRVTHDTRSRDAARTRTLRRAIYFTRTTLAPLLVCYTRALCRNTLHARTAVCLAHVACARLRAVAVDLLARLDRCCTAAHRCLLPGLWISLPHIFLWIGSFGVLPLLRLRFFAVPFTSLVRHLALFASLHLNMNHSLSLHLYTSSFLHTLYICLLCLLFMPDRMDLRLHFVATHLPTFTLTHYIYVLHLFTHTHFSFFTHHFAFYTHVTLTLLFHTHVRVCTHTHTRHTHARTFAV